MRLLKQLFKWLVEEIKQAFYIVKDNLFLIVGVGIFVYNYSLFRFRSELCEVKGGLGLKLKPPTSRLSYRCYTSISVETTISFLVIGAILIVIGILIIKERKK